jgi:hypothetical protein
LLARGAFKIVLIDEARLNVSVPIEVKALRAKAQYDIADQVAECIRANRDRHERRRPLLVECAVEEQGEQSDGDKFRSLAPCFELVGIGPLRAEDRLYVCEVTVFREGGMLRQDIENGAHAIRIARQGI